MTDAQATSPMPSHPAFQVIDFGLTPYESIWQQQKSLVQERLSHPDRSDILLLGEHPPVITLGRGSHPENLLNPSIPTVEIERGGDVTYHGPGQLVIYPILHLQSKEQDLHHYLRRLEESVILTLHSFGLSGFRQPGWTGVWVNEEAPLKVASIGVAVKRWVTYHGIGLNVSTDLNAFTQLNPCGLKSEIMTSLQHLMPENPPSMNEVKHRYTEAFSRCFERDIIPDYA